MAHDLESAEESATRIVRRSRGNYKAPPLVVKELDPKTHYGTVLAEAHRDERETAYKRFITKQKSADDSPPKMNIHDALGQGRN